MINELKKDGLKVIFLLVFFTLIYMIPLFSFLIYLIWPIPIVYFIEKYDIRKAIVVILLSALLNTILISLFADISTGVILGMYSITGFGLIGFFLGSAIKERYSPLKTLMLTIIAVFISNLLLTYVFSSTYQEIWSSLISLIGEGLTEESLLILEHSISIAKLIRPVSILIFSIITGTLIYYITTWYIIKQGINIKRYKPFKKWRFHRLQISFFSIIILLLLFLQYRVFFIKPDIINPILINLLVFLLFLVFLQGLAVIFHYFALINSRFIKMAIVFIFIFLFRLLAIASIIIIVIGLIDMWFNLRKEKTE